MRQEEFTAAKEARLRAMGAEILTVDPTYNAGPSGERDGGGAIVSVARNAEAAAVALNRVVVTPAPVEVTPPATASEDGGSGAQQGVGQGEAAGEGGEAYQPKVTTWGVFPRPKDISKEYGGGRDLKPGQALETKEQRAAREAAYAAALAAYKEKVWGGSGVRG
jgi:hypothetical protein